jgi:hypothetical protein
MIRRTGLARLNPESETSPPRLSSTHHAQFRRCVWALLTRPRPSR